MQFRDHITVYLRKFADDTTASASVEFVIIAPFLFYFVFSVFEAGWLMTQQTMLARGLNMAIRDLRIGNVPPDTAENMHYELRRRVCNQAAILRDCMNAVHLELQIMTLAGGIPQSSAQCVDRTPDSIQPVVNVSLGARNDAPDIMFVRVCYVVDPLLPGMGIGAQLTKDPTGAFHVVAFSAFQNEP